MRAAAARVLEPRFPTAFPVVAPEDVRPWLTVQRTLKRRGRKRRGRVETATFVLVLLVGLYVAWWIGPRIDVSLAGVFEAPEAFGFVRQGAAPRHLVGYDVSATGASVEAASR